jgi:hypothetical protein
VKSVPLKEGDDTREQGGREGGRAGGMDG